MKEMLRCWAEIDRGALVHNFRELRAVAGPGTGLIPAVKARAYGHGMDIVAPVLEVEGAAMFGVASVAEGLELRRIGVGSPVLVLGGTLPAEVPGLVEAGFSATVSHAAEVRALGREAARRGVVVPVHCKVDTGMGRLGCWHEDAAAFLRAAGRVRGAAVEGVMSHFASADDDPALTREQLRRFLAVREACPAGDALWHCANSAALLGYPGARLDMARPGIALYGYPPGARWRGRFRPVMRWKARVTLVKDVGRGRTISYGATFRVARPMRVATVAAGYGDGYPRSLSGRARVLVRGRSCPVLGRVTMDQVLVDVTRAEGVRAGDEVLLMGPGLCAETLARWAGTISYEILTGVSARVPRLAA